MYLQATRKETLLSALRINMILVLTTGIQGTVLLPLLDSAVNIELVYC
jgi:hypothetical protein